MIEYLKKMRLQESITRLGTLKPRCWIRVVDPNEDEINYLVNSFKLDRNEILDGLDVNEVPRIDSEEDVNYIFLRLPRYGGEFATDSFLFILTKNNFITISRENLGILDQLSNSQTFLTNHKTRALLQILAHISKSFNFNVNKILKEVKKDRRNILNLNSKDILDLVKQEDIFNDYIFSFSPLIDIYNKLLKSKIIQLEEGEKEFIEDLVIDLNQTLNSCKSGLKTINNMRDYYSTTLSNDRNNTLKILTACTVFLTVPTIFSSLYGMNIRLPGQNLSGMFWILIGIIFLIWFLVFQIFKKLRFL